jgi:4,5-dihydroxyphthalate decarboxylase
MSLSSYTILRSEGDERFIAIPVFPSRIFRQSAVYVRDDARIEKPEDLKGKRVGVGDYQMTAAVWVRGFLQHDYGVRPEEIHWLAGRPIRAVRPPPGVPIELAVGSLEDMLELGEIDALVSVMLPKKLGSGVRRLFKEFRTVEADYYRRTGIFPIMHTVALKRSIYEKHPWLAVSLYKAFCRSRDLARRSLYDTDALTVSVPWIIDEIERTREIAWDYSIEGSRPTLEALVSYLDEQRLTRRRMKVEELFAPNIDQGLGQYLRATGED